MIDLIFSEELFATISLFAFAIFSNISGFSINSYITLYNWFESSFFSFLTITCPIFYNSIVFNLWSSSIEWWNGINIAGVFVAATSATVEAPDLEINRWELFNNSGKL